MPGAGGDTTVPRLYEGWPRTRIAIAAGGKYLGASAFAGVERAVAVPIRIEILNLRMAGQQPHRLSHGGSLPRRDSLSTFAGSRHAVE